MRLPRSVTFLITVALGAGCDRPTGPQPPRILFGQQECDECRMIISDERFAAALVFREGEAAYRGAVFDDVGCLFAHERASAPRPVAARYVRDQLTRQWLSAETATYVRSSSIETPMASGVAAAATPQAAAELAAAIAGPATVLDWPALRRLFIDGGPGIGGSGPGGPP